MKTRKNSTNKDNKGYTLIELIVTLAIVGIVAGLAFTFLMTNLNSSNMVMDDTELQYQAQMAMNFITEKAMQSSGIVRITKADNMVDGIIDNTDSNNVCVFNFQTESKYLRFVLTNNCLYYDYKDKKDEKDENNDEDKANRIGVAAIGPDSILAECIEYINITPLGKDAKGNKASYRSTNSIKITICLKNDKESFILSNIVYMRNK